MTRTRLSLAIVATLSVSSSCTTHVTPVDVQAQRAEYQAITIDWLRYVDADAHLTEEQRERRRRSAQAQDLRIRALEEVVR